MKRLKQAAFGLWLTDEKATALEAIKDKVQYFRKDLVEPATTDDDEGTDISIISSQSVDIVGDVVLQDGINWQTGASIPVLYGHEASTMLPIGKCLWIKRDGDKTLAKTQYAKTTFAQDCYLLVKDGFLSGKSIGFTCYPEDCRLPTPEEEAQYPGVRQIIQRCDIWEYSLTPTPCNTEARLQSVKSLVSENTLKHLGIEPESVVEARTQEAQAQAIKQILGSVDEFSKDVNELVCKAPAPKKVQQVDLQKYIKSLYLTDEELDEIIAEAEEEIYKSYGA